MCDCGGMGYFDLPRGIPITQETHNGYSPELQAAWTRFNDWWHKVADDQDGPISQSSMPPEVKADMDTILAAPIPGFEGVTGADSCYMINVQERLVPNNLN